MKRCSTLLATVLLATAAMPARAATYLVSFTGSVSDGYDTSGAFGTAGISLDGLAYKTVYTLTIPKAGAYSYDDGTATGHYGGTAYGSGIPSPVSATITINGITQQVSGDYYGSHGIVDGQGEPSYGYDGIFENAGQYETDGVSYDNSYVYDYIYSYVNIFELIDAENYQTPQTYTADPFNDYRSGQFYFYGYTDSGATLTRSASGNLTPETVTIAIAAGVPEPATWMMMITGIGMAGVAMRRRPRPVVAAA